MSFVSDSNIRLSIVLEHRSVFLSEGRTQKKRWCTLVRKKITKHEIYRPRLNWTTWQLQTLHSKRCTLRLIRFKIVTRHIILSMSQFLQGLHSVSMWSLANTTRPNAVEVAYFWSLQANIETAAVLFRILTLNIHSESTCSNFSQFSFFLFLLSLS